MDGGDLIQSRIAVFRSRDGWLREKPAGARFQHSTLGQIYMGRYTTPAAPAGWLLHTDPLGFLGRAKNVSKANQIFDYMTARAKDEGMAHDLPVAWYEAHFDCGLRSFFNVHLDANGNLLEDTENPAFFAKYDSSARPNRALFTGLN
jgi:hypothetical protein